VKGLFYGEGAILLNGREIGRTKEGEFEVTSTEIPSELFRPINCRCVTVYLRPPPLHRDPRRWARSILRMIERSRS